MKLGANGVRKMFVAVAAVVVALGVLDAVWLAIMVPSVYRQQLGTLLADQPIWAAAVAFYLLYAAGLLLLVVLPALRAGQPSLGAGLRGGLLGLIAYGTYDLTNLATLQDWPVVLSVIDMAWGSVLTAIVAFIAVRAARRFG